MKDLLPFALASFVLSGCAVGMTIDEHGTETKHYLGYVAVQRPTLAGKVFSRDATAVGISFERGLSVGYMRDRHIVVPLDCRMVFVVRSQAEVDQVLARLSTDEKLRSACAVLDNTR